MLDHHVGHRMRAMDKTIIKLAFPDMKVNIHKLCSMPSEYLGDDYVNYLKQLYRSKNKT